MYEKHFSSAPVSENCLVELYDQHALRICAVWETIFSFPKKLSNGMEHVVCMRMVFVISKYLVHTMFREGDEAQNASPAACEWISNIRIYAFFGSEIYAYMQSVVGCSHSSGFLPAQPKKKINMYSQAYGLWIRINQILWSRSSLHCWTFFPARKWCILNTAQERWSENDVGCLCSSTP